MITKALNESDILKTAISVDCDVAVIKTLIDVEGYSDGFLQSEEPVIYFHKDVFSRQTRGVYDNVAPDVSNPIAAVFIPAIEQHELLHKAILLDKDAALMATSWGKFRIMGYNYALAGFDSLQDFISAMYESEAKQLDAFVTMLINLSLGEDLKNKNWESFATKYAQIENRSDLSVKLLQAYTKYA